MNRFGRVGVSLACFILSLGGSAQVTSEPPSPKAGPIVQTTLNAASRLLDAKQAADSLKAAEQALDTARHSKDMAGEAFAQQARANALQELKLTDEAIAAWQSAADIWEKTGDIPEQITTLVQTGLLIPLERKADAKKLFAVGLSAAKSETRRPLALAHTLHESGVNLGDKNYEQFSLDYLGTALGLWEQLRPESVDRMETLNALGRFTLTRAIRENSDPLASKARDYFAQAVDVGRRIAPTSPILVESLRRLADAEYELSVNDRHSNEHYLEALRIREQITPDGSMEEAGILRGLAVDEIVQGDIGAAHEHLAKAVAIGERLAPTSADFEHILENWAEVQEDEGDLISARAIMERALSLRQKLPNPDIAPTYINLGALALLQADYTSARSYLEKALALDANVKQVVLVIPYALASLSEMFYQQGDFTSALEYRRRALAYDQEKIGEFLGTAHDLNGIGNILRAQHDFASASEYYRKALEMRRKLAPGSLDVVDSLQSLAMLARQQGDLPQAQQYDLEALELKRKVCPNSWCTAEILSDLGEIAYQQGDLNGAAGYLKTAADMREKGLGSMHPDFARSLRDLALTDAALGKTSEALDASLRAERIGTEHLRISVRALSERQALAYEAVRASGLDVALSLLEDPNNAASARSEVFDTLIHSRALVLDELAARHRSAYGSGDTDVARIAGQLASARAQLATVVLRGVGDIQPEAYRRLLDDLRTKKESAERQLAEKSIAFRQDQARERIGLKDVAAALPKKSAIIAFVRYTRHSLKNWPGKVPPAPVPSYGAFILRAENSAPEFVPLGAAHTIEKLVSSWRQEISRQSEAVVLSAATNSETESGIALRHKIWDPLLTRLGGVAQVFVVPDAGLHLVNLAALPVGNQRYLVETGPLIHYISTERDLVPFESHQGEGILIVGNPAFDQPANHISASDSQMAPADVPGSDTVLRGSRSSCGTLKTLRFTPLPASQQEADRISALWEVAEGSKSRPNGAEMQQVTGTNASPEAFIQYAPGKRVLHVATHGFFLEGQCASTGQLGADSEHENKLPVSAENPLLLSGLAFAGANRRNAENTKEGDGILTAEEIAGINLEGVDWAVLSACDTGVGEIKLGEGVFGLRRAFQVAGAKTVIMSLWPIEDETARRWMEVLYREHFLNGKNTAEALRSASLQILRQRRAKHLSTQPIYWGAFIAAGNWQ